MKNAILTTILLFAVAMTAAAQPEIAPRTVETEGLHGLVRMVVTTWNYMLSDSSGYAVDNSTTMTFDTAGRLTMYVEMGSDGLDGVYSYDYDTQGRISRYQLHYGEPHTETYVYDDGGRLWYTEVRYSDAFQESNHGNVVTAYDKQGRVLTIEDTMWKQTYVYSYNQDGTLRSITTQYNKGETTMYYGQHGLDSVTGTKYYEYDDNGNVVKMVTKWPNLNEIYTITYTYDKADFDMYGNWWFRKITCSDGTQAFERRQIIYYEEEKNKNK